MVAAADLITAAGEAAFAIARARTGRSAFKLFREAERVPATDAASLLAAKERFRQLPLLLDPDLRALSLAALTGARGPLRDGASPFPATLWRWGATCVSGGEALSWTIVDFVAKLRERAVALAPKREGWVIEPTACNGERTNAGTTEMHALFLDADDTGEWAPLLGALASLNICHVAYQSGGWSPTTPKWRVVLPLAKPFDVRGEANQGAWKKFYHQARTALGAIAQLLSVGFDPATDTPCCPWFLTERREPGDSLRQVAWRPGHALDAVGLLLHLPEVEEDDAASNHERGAAAAAAPVALTDAEAEKVVAALAAATADIPGNRRDLYLSLPGALLDRGVAPDVVLDICESVSERYPRSHPDKHADNVHCAKTTVDKWLRGDRVTRIGTLNELLPSVASALDTILPDLATMLIADSIEESLRSPPPTAAASAPTTMPPTATASAPRQRKIKPTPVSQAAAKVGKRLKKKVKNKLSAVIIECLVCGVPVPASSVEEADNLLAIAMTSLGRHLHVDTTWQSVLDFASRSLSLMDVTRSVERTDAIARAFYVGQGQRRLALQKKANKSENNRQILAGDAQKCLL